MLRRLETAFRAFRRSWSTYSGGRWAVDEDDTNWLSSETSSGVKIGRRKAYSVSHWYRALSIISSTCAKTAIDVLDTAAGGRSRDTTHPVALLLSGAGKPNADTLKYHFVQTLTAHAVGHGGGFAYIFRDKRGRPTELLQLVPDRTFPVRENGVVKYVTTVDGEQRKLLAENVLHVHGMGWDGLTGYSVLTLAADALGSAIAKEQFGSRFFKNSATPSVVISTTKKLTDAAFKNLERSWVSMRSGLEHAHKPVILEEGSTLTPFSVNADDSQLIQAMERDPVLIANFTGVPPHMLGVKGYNSYNSLEIMSQELLDYCIDPWLHSWEGELEEKCLTEREKSDGSRQIRYRRRELIRVDFAKRYAAHRTALGGHPFRSVNEVRADEGEESVTAYDFIPSPLNMTGNPNNPNVDPATGLPVPDALSDRAALRSLIDQTTRRMVGRLVTQLERKKSGADEAAVLSENRSVMEAAFAPLCGLARAKHKASDIVSELCRSAIAAQKDGSMTTWSESTPARVVDTLCPEKTA